MDKYIEIVFNPKKYCSSPKCWNVKTIVTEFQIVFPDQKLSVFSHLAKQVKDCNEESENFTYNEINENIITPFMPVIDKLKINGTKIPIEDKSYLTLTKNRQKILRINQIDTRMNLFKKTTRDPYNQWSKNHIVKNMYNRYFETKSNAHYNKSKPKTIFFCSKRAIQNNDIARRKGLIEDSICIYEKYLVYDVIIN